MLQALRIRGFAIMDELEMVFERGLNVITGETGAGKSLLMQALGLAIGGKAVGEVVRHGSEEAVIEASFVLEGGRARHLLEESGLEGEEGFVVRRVLSRSGRGRIYINGTLAPLGLLRRLGEALVHIYGQHEQHTLLRPEAAIELLDGFGGLRAEGAEMEKRFGELSQTWTRLKALREKTAASLARQELLHYQSEEIARAGLRPGEEEELRQERQILLHAEKLYEGAALGEELLYAGEGAVVDQLGRLLHRLRELTRIDGSLKEVQSLLEGGLAQIEEGALHLRKYRDRMAPDPERLEAVENRLALISRLKQKYGSTVEEVLAFKEALDRELGELAFGEESMAALEKELEHKKEIAWQWAERLSESRRRVARDLEQRMEKELSSLGMKGATFAVKWAPSLSEAEPSSHPFWSEGRRLTEKGYDRLEFYLSANPGEPLLRLAQVASGGELSRIMLALKTLGAAEGEVPTLIFDEVDAGIGGAVAEVVGRKLKALGQKHQVLCITHLPQIAALADHHYTVVKKTLKGRTLATARRLSAKEQLLELARMVGGVEITEGAKRHAREMLEQARRVAGRQ